MKVLCLHGYAQNSEAFSRKCTVLRQTFEKYAIEPIFANGPIPVPHLGEPPAGGARRDLRAWWVVDNSPEKYRFERGVEALQAVVKAHGPFDGILGFSQGAAFAGVLAMNMDKFFPDHPPLSFAIFFCGFRLRLPIYQKYYANPIDIPTCHVVGENDTIVDIESSAKLFQVCEKSNQVLIKHPGAHFVPTSPQVMDEIDAFLAHALQK